MSFADFKVLTFDIVGTCIDFEKGVLDGFRAAGGPAAAKLSEDEIFGAYLKAREQFPGAASAVMRDVYIAAAKTLGLPADDAADDCYFRYFFNAPAFPDSADALRRLRRKFRLVAMRNYDRVAYTNCANKLGLPFRRGRQPTSISLGRSARSMRGADHHWAVRVRPGAPCSRLRKS